MKKKKGLKPAAAILIIAAVSVLSLLFGNILAARLQDTPVTPLENAKTITLDTTLEQIRSGDLDEICENSIAAYKSLDSKEAYKARISAVLEDLDPELLHIVYDDEDHYRLYCEDQYVAPLEVVEISEDEFQVLLPITGTKSYLVEVPTGKKLYANGIEISSSNIKEKNIPASNFWEVRETNYIPYVDLYEIKDLIDLPELDLGDQAEYTLLEDPMSGNYLFGKTVKDKELLQMAIDYAETLAAYPAQDGNLGAVSAIALTSSSWYPRYTGIQNYWFTAHQTSKFSNEEVLKAAWQSDDSFVAHVILDYFADNGEVHRTWYIGYQLTLINTPNGWKIGAIEINNELNPRTVIPE